MNDIYNQLSPVARFLVDKVAPAENKSVTREADVKRFIKEVIPTMTLTLPPVPGRQNEPFDFVFEKIDLVFKSDVYAVFQARMRSRILFIKLFQKSGYIVNKPFDVLNPSKVHKEFKFPEGSSAIEGAYYTDIGLKWFWVKNLKSKPKLI